MWRNLALRQHCAALNRHSACEIKPLITLPTPTAAIEASTIAPAAHTALVITKSLALIGTEIATTKVLRLTALALLAAGILHAGEHGAHGAHGGWVHLAGIHATTSHHLLHHLLHLWRHSLHAWHAARGSALARPALATTCSARHHARHSPHAHHHHILHVLHHLLVVSSDGVGIELLPHGALLGGVERPGELIESIVEIIGQIGAGPSPWLVVLGEVLVDIDLCERLARGLVGGDGVDVEGGGPDSGKIGAAGLFPGGRRIWFLGRGFCCSIVGYRALGNIFDIAVSGLSGRLGQIKQQDSRLCMEMVLTMAALLRFRPSFP